jgi:molybdopterin-guanine dinucleotide biosynthesis protein A
MSPSNPSADDPRTGALVLCGGRSRRMGRDKATLPFGDEVLLQRVVRRVSEVVDEVLVVARPGQELPLLPPAVRVVFDDVPDQGPLGGLVPGLRAARAPVLFATACDTPFLAPALVTLLFERTADHDVAVARTEGYLHPLCAAYRRTVLAPLAALLAAGQLRPVFLYDEVPTCVVEEAELRDADPQLRSLANLNTPEAYEAALAEATQ